MKYSLVILILLCLTVQYSKSVSQLDSVLDNHHTGLFFKRHPGNKLSLGIEDTTQMTLQVYDEISCAHSCVRERWCRSVNFKITASEKNGLHPCELISSDVYNQSKNLKQDEKFIHLSIKVRCWHDVESLLFWAIYNQ
jgi:hypothetical protein